MPRKGLSPHPAVRRLLGELGENLRLARLRRGFSMALVAERAGMSLPTLRAIEHGEPGVTLGSYANVLHSLGLHEDLALIARDDELGRKLQDAELPTRRRAPKRTPVARSSKKVAKKDTNP
ncbi:MAG: helix-turn-helix domain-containing protein [Deltaproteobacteria bacterium]|nr:helix-turn-helix domain-containing protein [Deltaproteobacteria bacterium]